VLIGIFVGGRSSRMGRPKGLLAAPDSGEPLLVRSCRLARSVGLSPCLVGAAQPYAALVPELTRVSDAPPRIGPLGGLCALLQAAHGQPVLALACDLPHISARLLERLAQTPSDAAVLAPRGAAGLWEPLCACYDAARVATPLQIAIAAGVRSFQRLFAQLEVADLPLEEAERRALEDWDSPEDMRR
jgi:molybdopterin-guanine dinucleotide biosynthesis protein A